MLHNRFVCLCVCSERESRTICLLFTMGYVCGVCGMYCTFQNSRLFFLAKEKAGLKTVVINAIKSFFLLEGTLSGQLSPWSSQ